MTRYRELGLRPVINAAATLTKLGGSVMPPPVVDAMTAAAASFVDLEELQAAAGRRIATLTGNEAAYICCGAAAGITLTVAACIAGIDAELQQDFPYLERAARREVIVFRGQRNGYDYAARATGARLIEIEPDVDELASALARPSVAAFLYFAGAHFAEHALPVEDVITHAEPAGVPVIIDAAAQIPPISNLWHFTRELGATGAIFSGGKGLRGPQASGLILGRDWLIEGCRVHGAPRHSLGRGMKVGKEEMAGLLTAVEWSLAQDEPALLERYERIVDAWLEGLRGFPGITVERSFPSEAGQPHSRALIRFTPSASISRDAVVDALWDRDPRIAVSAEGDDAIALNPQTVEDAEVAIVLEALWSTLTRAG